jgi:hypothetical protein
MTGERFMAARGRRIAAGRHGRTWAGKRVGLRDKNPSFRDFFFGPNFPESGDLLAHPKQIYLFSKITLYLANLRALVASETSFGFHGFYFTIHVCTYSWLSDKYIIKNLQNPLFSLLDTL